MLEPIRPRLVAVLLPVLTTITAVAPPIQPTTTTIASLIVTPATAHLGDEITLRGGEFESCTEPPVVGALSTTEFTLRSDPAGIELPQVPIAASFDHAQATVSPDAAPGKYLITASCTNVRRRSIPPSTVTASATVSVLVERDEAAGQGSTDPPGNRDQTTDSTAQVEPLPATAPDPWAIGLVALALAALVVAAAAVRRWLVRRPPALRVTTVAGVVVGPAVVTTPPTAGGLQVVPHPDPGRREVRTW